MNDMYEATNSVYVSMLCTLPILE